MKLKNFYAIILLCIAMLGGGWLKDQAPQNPIVSSYQVIPDSEAHMDQIAEQFSVEHKLAEGYEVFVSALEKEAFLKLVPKAKLLEENISAKFYAMADGDFAGFHTFETVKTHLEKIQATYPEMVTYGTYGSSMEGRPLHYMRLLTKDGPAKKPQIALTSATHGNEISTVEVVFGILEHLLDQYGKDVRITRLVENHEIYFLPVVNPDGYVRKERLANGIDPNRDYPWPEKPQKNSNPCIEAVMKFFQEREIKGSIDFHSAASMIMYPWGYTKNGLPPSDHAAFESLTKKMAAHNGFIQGQISKTIYVAKGSSADYYYWKFGTKALGIELRSEGSSSAIQSQVKENLESTLTFIEAF